MLNRALVEKEFEFMKDVVYLDTSKVNLPPVRVQNTWKDYIDGYVREYALNYSTYFPEKVERAKAELAKLLKVSPQEIALTHSACDSMTLLANSFPFQAGDNVIITAEEHASNAVPWLALKRFGVQVKVIEREDGFVSADQVIAAIDENTRLVSTSSAFFCGGYKIDFAKVGRYCKEKGIVYAVDATQSLGITTIYPKEMDIDYLAGGGHKALLGPKSIGVAYCSNELAEKLRPHTGSLQGVLNAGRPCALRDYDDIEWAPGATRLESGNYPFGVIDALASGVSLINELGIENIEAEALRLEAILRSKLDTIPLRVVTPPKENRYGMFLIYYPENADPNEVAEILWKHRVRATVRYDYVRMTVDFFNTVEQMDTVEAALREIAALADK